MVSKGSNVQAFLSHSSTDKWYVRKVAERLGRSNVVLDEWTFEAGNRTMDEICSYIDACGVFVFFISESSLSSDWVKAEILEAEDKLGKGTLLRIVPFIIDPKITHADERIPEWMRSAYNLRYISKPTKCASLVQQKLRMLSWELVPARKAIDQLFIGRSEQMQQFEQRLYDMERPEIRSIIVSGLNSIGRRKFLRNALVTKNKMPAHYSPLMVTLSASDSFEDFILKLYGLGFSNLTPLDFSGIRSKNMEEKLRLACSMMEELSGNNDVLFVEDVYCVVSRDGDVADWCVDLVNSLNSKSSFCCCFISLARVRFKSVRMCPSLYCVEIPELSVPERTGLFLELADIEEFDISRDDQKLIAGVLSGFPKQVFYSVALIKQEGMDFVRDNLHLIVEFNKEHVSRIVKPYEKDEFAMQILRILSLAESWSLSMLEHILTDDFSRAKDYIVAFANTFVIEYTGNMKEFIRLNDGVKDYIQRIDRPLDRKYDDAIREYVKTVSSEGALLLERDTSEFYLTFKECLKKGIAFPKELLVPSMYINAIKELYNYEKNYNAVIVLTKRALQDCDLLDRRVEHELRYWYCLALARKRDKTFLAEVQKIDGLDHHFLLGFFYRLTGKYSKAAEQLVKVIRESRHYPKAKRELVQVYLNSEMFPEAYSLARESYEADMRNPFNIQSYIICIIKTNDAERYVLTPQLLAELKDCPHEKAEEMYLTSYAQYQAFVVNDKDESLAMLDAAIEKYPHNIYPYLTKLDILRQKPCECIDEIRETMARIKDSFDADSDIFFKYSYVYCRCYLYNLEGNVTGIMNCINTILTLRFPVNVVNRFRRDFGV